MVDEHLERGHELFRLARPVAHHGGRRHHERGSDAVVFRQFIRCRVGFRLRPLDGEQAQQLEGFAQPHVIGKHGADVVAGHPVQPVHAAALVWAQLRAHGVRDVHPFRRRGLHAAQQRGVPRRSGELNRVLARRFEREFAQIRHAGGSGKAQFVVPVTLLAGLLQLLHVLGDAAHRLRIGHHPIAAQLDKPRLGVDQVGHLLLSKLRVSHGDAPVILDEVF